MSGMEQWAKQIAANVRARGYLQQPAGVNVLGQAIKLIEEAAEVVQSMSHVPFHVRRATKSIKSTASHYFALLPTVADGDEVHATKMTLDEAADVLVVIACLLDSLSERWTISEAMDAALMKSAADVGRGAPGWNGKEEMNGG